MSKVNQAQRILRHNWIAKLLNNFETTKEVQEVVLATLWTLLETGTFRGDMILSLLGISESTEISKTLPDTLIKVKHQITTIQIPTEDGLLPLVIRNTGQSYSFNPALSDWEDNLVNELADAIPTMFPSSIPAPAKDKQYIDGTWVIKHSKKTYKDQSVRTAPLVFRALNILNEQKYRLNTDILALQNLPETTSGISPKHRLNRLLTMSCFKDTFHFRYTLDFRGRIYARSVVVTPQGDSFAKAAIDMATKLPVKKSGLQALGIHFANQSGLDKASYVQRLQWARNEGFLLAKEIYNCNHNWLKLEHILLKDNAFEQYTAALDWYRALTSSNPEQYKSSLVVHQDATNSGFQFGAALLKDHEAAEHVNITSTTTQHDKPADLYGNMAKAVIEKVKTTAPHWLPYITRKFCKIPIMVTGYGAGETIVEADILTFMEEYNIPLDFEDIKAEFFAALEETVGSMTVITKTMKKHSKDIIDRGDTLITWTTPDGFKVYHQYYDTSDRKVQLTKTVSAIRHKRKGEVDPLSEQMKGALSPNWIHSMDGSMLRLAARKSDEQNIAFCPIHDSFGTHAANYWALHKVLKQAFIETMEYTWYTNLCKENNVKEIMRPIGHYDIKQAVQSPYMFS